MSPREFADTNLKREQERAVTAMRNVQLLEQVVHHLPDWLQVDFIHPNIGYKAKCSVSLLPVETREEAIALAMKLNPVPIVSCRDRFVNITPLDDAPDKTKCSEWADDILPYYLNTELRTYRHPHSIECWVDMGVRTQFHVRYNRETIGFKAHWNSAYPPRDRWGELPPPDYYTPTNLPTYRTKHVLDSGKQVRLTFAKPKEPTSEG